MPSNVIRHGRYHASDPLRCGERFYPAVQEEAGLTPQYAVVYLSTGGVTYSDAGHAAIELKAGDAFQRFPERPHRMRFRAGTQTHYIAVPAEIFGLMRSLGLRTAEHPRLRIGVHDWLVKRHARLSRELRNCPPQRLMAALTAMQQLIVDMHLHAAAREVSPGAARRIELACARLSADFEEKLSMPRVAREVGLSYPNFRKLFRAVAGMPPGDYRVRRRNERAQELLLQGASASDAARELGYPDLFSFSAQFKRVCGVSPRRFLKEQS